MTSKEENTDVEMEIDPLDDHYNEPKVPLDRHHPVESADHHQPEDLFDHHQTVDPLDQHQSEDSLGHHQLKDLLDHHQLTEPVNHQLPEDPLDHNQLIAHNQQDVSFHHHQVVEPLKHQQPEMPLEHNQQVVSLNHHQTVEPLDQYQPVVSFDHNQLVEQLVHHQLVGSSDHHKFVEILDNDQPIHPLDHCHNQSEHQLDQQNSKSSYYDEEIFMDNFKRTKHTILMEKIKDVREKIIIANSILQTCKDDKKQSIAGMPILVQLRYLTKQPLHYLNKVVGDDKLEKISLKQAIMDTNSIPTTVLPFINDDIRNIFIEYYVKKKQMPTKMDLLKSLCKKRDDTFYKNVKISTLVKNNLVKYHHLPKLNRFILTENPELAYQRHLYLRQITGFRSRGKNTIYVTVMKVQKTLDKHDYNLALAASSTAGLIGKRDNVNFGDLDAVVGNNQIRAWIQCELIPKLAQSSVIVLMQLRNNDTPTPFSSKDAMLQWLQKRDIPVDDESHKAQLYNLVKVFKKKNKEKGFYDEVFRSAGFQVVVCPTEYENLDFFRDIYMSVTCNVSVNMVKMMRKLSLEEWLKMEAKIIEGEKQMMRDDNEMGRIIDNIFEMVQNGALKEKDFPEGCRWTEADNFATHIGDIIVD